ncbi:hypothetical protein SAMN04487988_1192 [Algoriphagus hitonicola]|uniref:Uncharacterized protein n=1 Tax=Algoriphagus hitonicola TaxID=435880 RepID=A0A1I2XL43_9BACT|nr:hypothetical protein SAMN04487988_1192 [Algoriphagus hitonicola]
MALFLGTESEPKSRKVCVNQSYYVDFNRKGNWNSHIYSECKSRNKKF